MSETTPARIALIVAGMHRSGTSSVAGTLVALGCTAPKTLMPVAAENPKGFWESATIMELNDRILASAGSTWFDWRPFNADWYQTPVPSAFASEAKHLLTQEYDQSPLFVLKDPRICRFLPFWTDILEQSSISAKFLIPLRHPADVALSLADRNRFSQNASLLLWLRHVLDAEQATRGKPRVIFRWEDLLNDPRKTVASIGRSLGIKWPRQRDFANVDITNFLTRDLHRHHAAGTPTRASMDELATEVYDTLITLSTRPAKSLFAKLDNIRAKLDTASEIFGPVFAATERTLHTTPHEFRSADPSGHALGTISFAPPPGPDPALIADQTRLASENTSLQAQLTAAKHDIERATHEHIERESALRATIAHLNEAITNAKSDYVQIQQQLQEANNNLNQATAEHATVVRDHQKQLDASRTALEASRALEITLTQRIAATVANAETTESNQKQIIADLQDKLTAQHSNLQAASAEIENLRQTIGETKLRFDQQLAQQNERSAAMLEEERTALSAARHECDEIRKRLTDLEAQTETDNAQQLQVVAELDTLRAGLERAKAQHQTEIAAQRSIASDLAKTIETERQRHNRVTHEQFAQFSAAADADRTIIENLRSQLTKLSTELAEARNNESALETRCTDIETSLSNTITAERSEVHRSKAEINRLEETLQALRQENMKMQLDHAASIKALSEKNAEQLDSIALAKDEITRLNAAIIQTQIEVTKATDERVRQEADTRKTVDDQKHRHNLELQHQRSRFNEELQSHLSNFAAERNRLEADWLTALEDERRRHNLEIQHERLRFNEELQSQVSNFATERNRLEAEWLTALEEDRQGHSRRLLEQYSALNAEIDRERVEHDRTRSALDQARIALQHAHESEVQRSSLENDLGTKERENARLRQDIEAFQHRVAELMERLGSALAEIRRLKQQLSQEDQANANLKQHLNALESKEAAHQERLRTIGRSGLKALNLLRDMHRRTTHEIRESESQRQRLEDAHRTLMDNVEPAWRSDQINLRPTQPGARGWLTRLAAPTAPPPDLTDIITRADEANRARNWTSAAALYAEALRADPSLAAIWVQYGHAAKELGEHTLAELAYARALKLEPTNADTHLQLGHLLKLMGRTEAARTAYNQAAQIDPNLVDARNELAALPPPTAPVTTDPIERDLQQILSTSFQTYHTPTRLEQRQTPGFAAPDYAWPPASVNDYWLPQTLRDFIVESYGQTAPDLYQYLASLVEHHGSNSASFEASIDSRILLHRAQTLASAEEKRPKASIVIPAYNNVTLTLTCIVSILETVKDIPFEILVGDDASTDGTAGIIGAIGGNIRLVRHDANKGFLANCNETALHAQGDILVMLNNDTLVFPGWLEHLLAPFQRDSSIGLVGSMLLNGDGSLQEAGGIFWQDGSAWNFGRNQDPRLPEFNYAKEVDYISGASIAVPTKLWNSLGGFDPLFEPAYCEDADLAFRIRERGLKTWYEPRSRLIHHEGRSHGRDVSSGIKAYQVSNQRKFIERWRHILQRDHFPNAQNVLQARDRSRGKPRILVVDHYVPQWDRDAGSRTMYTYMKLLLDAGFHVIFWPDNLNRDPDYAPELMSLGIELQYFTQHTCPRFDDWLKKSAGTLDYALLSRPHVAVKYIDALRAAGPTKILFYGVDLHFLRLETRLRLTPSPELQAEIETTRELELNVCRRCDVAYYPGTEEVQYLRSHLPSNVSLQEFPIYVYDNPEISLAKAKISDIPAKVTPNILFVGGFNHTPNADGISWFVETVMPQVRSQMNGIHLHIVGSNPPAEILALAAPDITVHGRVSDQRLDELYAIAAAAIVPLRYGGGVKGKVIEAMAKGLPVVMTSIGAQGIDDASSCSFIGNDPDELSEMLRHCIVDRMEAQRRARNALLFIERKYSIQTVKEMLSNSIPEISGTR